MDDPDWPDCLRGRGFREGDSMTCCLQSPALAVLALLVELPVSAAGTAPAARIQFCRIGEPQRLEPAIYKSIKETNRPGSFLCNDQQCIDNAMVEEMAGNLYFPTGHMVVDDPTSNAAPDDALPDFEDSTAFLNETGTALVYASRARNGLKDEQLLRVVSVKYSHEADEFVRREFASSVLPRLKETLHRAAKAKRGVIELNVFVGEYDFARKGFPVLLPGGLLEAPKPVTSDTVRRQFFVGGESYQVLIANSKHSFFVAMDETKAAKVAATLKAKGTRQAAFYIEGEIGRVDSRSKSITLLASGGHLLTTIEHQGRLFPTWIGTPLRWSACSFATPTEKMASGTPEQSAQNQNATQDGNAELARDCTGAADCNNLGVKYDKGDGVPVDRARAASLFSMACTGGAATACTNLGYSYRDGTGVPADSAKAAEYFRRGCEGEHSVGCKELGVLYARGQGVPVDKARAVELYRKGCNGGFPASCVLAGAMYANGEGVDQDDAQAAAFFQRACDGGFTKACDLVAKTVR